MNRILRFGLAAVACIIVAAATIFVWKFYQHYAQAKLIRTILAKQTGHARVCKEREGVVDDLYKMGDKIAQKAGQLDDEQGLQLANQYGAAMNEAARAYSDCIDQLKVQAARDMVGAGVKDFEMAERIWGEWAAANGLTASKLNREE